MAEKKTGDPKDDEQPTGGARFVPVAGTYGTEVVVPSPLSAGPPQPEPEERWTLAPDRRPEPPAGSGHDTGDKDVAVEPVRGRVRRSGTETGEPDPT